MRAYRHIHIYMTGILEDLDLGVGDFMQHREIEIAKKNQCSRLAITFHRKFCCVSDIICQRDP